MSQALDKVCHQIAKRLPRRIIYWCAVIVAAHATQGQWSNQVVPDLTAMDSLKRWDM